MGQQVTRRGFEYQDLVALESLIELFNQKEIKSSVKIESSDIDVQNKTDHLDDIVIQSKTRCHLIQVKFCNNPQKDKMTWKWLLSKNANTKNGKKTIEKWKDDFDKLNTIPNFRASLYLNRTSEIILKTENNKSFIDWYAIDEETKNSLKEIDTNEKSWVNFFNNFDIIYSKESLEDKEIRLKKEIFDLSGSDNTFNRIIEHIKHHAMKIQYCDGKITYDMFKEIIEGFYPKLNQKFKIPENYIIPDETFHKRFMSKVKSNEKFIFLFGDSGAGKSSYLSNLIENIFSPSKYKIVRHHYYISNDSINYRIHHNKIIKDLQRQFGDNSQNLQQSINHYNQKKLKPIIVIDGLDHAIRDGEKSTEELQNLFNSLNNLKNCTIIFGSQPSMPMQKLPLNIRKFINNENKFNLPNLSIKSINHIIKSHIKIYNKINKHSLPKFLKVIKSKTKGNPTILNFYIKILENNTADDKFISEYSLKDIPVYNNNIQEFYNEYYVRLEQPSKNALDIIFNSCMNIWHTDLIKYSLKDDYLDKNIIDNAIKDLGVFFNFYGKFIKVKHQSFEIFLEKHTGKNNKYINYENNWLESLDESDFFKINFYDRSQIILGKNISNLISRKSIAESLSRGAFKDNIIDTLKLLEQLLLDNKKLPELIKIKHLRERLSYSSSVLESTEQEVLKLSILSSNNKNMIELINNNIYPNNLNELGIIQILKELNYDLESDNINELFEISRKKFNDKLLFEDGVKNQDFIDILNTAIESNKLTLKNIQSLSKNIYNISDIVRQALKYNRLDITYNCIKHLSITDLSYNIISEISYPISSLLLIEEVNDIRHIKNSKEFISKSPILYIIHKINNIEYEFDYGFFEEAFNQNLAKRVERIYEGSNLRFIELEDILIEYFFYNLLLKLSNKPKFNIGVDTNKIYGLLSYINMLDNLVEDIYQKGVNNMEAKDLINIIDKNFNDVIYYQESTYWNSKKTNSNLFYHIWLLIFSNFKSLSVDNFNTIKNYIYFDYTFSSINNDANSFFSKDVIKEHIKDLKEYTFNNTDIYEILRTYEEKLKYYQYIKDYDSIKECTTYMWYISTGYEFHKDLTSWNTINAIKYCFKNDIGLSSDWINRLTPIIENICIFTDGDHTRYSKQYYGELLSLKDESLALAYLEHLNGDDETYNNPYIAKCLKESLIKNKVLEAHNKDSISEFKEICFEDSEYDKKENNKFNLDTLIKFTPSKLGDLIDFLKSNDRFLHEIYIIRWIDYWISKDSKKKSVILNAMLKNAKYIDKHCSYLKNIRFLLAYETNGKSEAYKYLVSSHIEMNGWHSNWAKGCNERLNIVAEKYSNSWFKYIKDTKLGKYDDDISITGDLLVYLLCKLELFKEAESIAETMLKSLEEDVEHLTLPESSFQIRYKENL